MFTKKDQPATSFDSSWKKEQNVSSSSCQTEPLQTKDEECQILDTAEVSIQTDNEEAPTYGVVTYNETSLLEFLKRVTPQVEDELQKMSVSRAFDGYSELNEGTSNAHKCIHTLRWQHILAEHVVMDVGWSSTGSVIGVGYGVRVHDDWCAHKGTVAVWNINRSEFAANTPDQVFETSSCVTCLAFHPNNPSILAVGNMAGEVMIFDLAKTEDATPYLRGDSDGVGITRLKWVSVPTSLPTEGKQDVSFHFKSSLSLVSTTAEGTVLVWNVHQAKENMTLGSGYLVTSEDVPRDTRRSFSDTSSVGLGLTSITFAVDDSSRFLLGTEGGAILVCSTLLMERSNASVCGVGLNKCVTSSLSTHAGRVLEASWSPFHRHAVHTLGSDKDLRLYSLLQPNKPVSVIYSEDEMTCSQWSPSRPLVVGVGKVAGQISFFNFASKNGQSILDLPSPEKESPISCLAFNKKDMRLLASGDQLGRVFIWQLNDAFISPSASEHTELANLVHVSAE